MGGNNTYIYAAGNPTRRIDPAGLSDEDVENAWNWLSQNYPELTEGVSVGPSRLLDYLPDVGGVTNPFADHFYIRQSYYDDCLSERQKSQLLNLLAHEALYIYLNKQVGTLNYLWNNSSYGYHDWIYDTSNNILNYWQRGWYWNPNPPPPQVYTRPPVDDYPKGPRAN